MNLFDFVPPFVSTKLCLVLLHSLWQMSLLVGVLWLIERIPVQRKQVAHLDNAETRYTINVAALGLGLVLLPITWAALDNPVLKATSASETTPTTKLQQNLPAELLVNRTNIVSNSAQPQDNVRIVMGSSAETPARPSPENVTAEGTSSAAIASPSTQPASTTLARISPWMVSGYVFGVVLMLIRMVLAFWKSGRISAKAQLITTGPILDKVQSLAKQWGMKTVPALGVVERAITPQIVGLLRPVILLPASAVTGMTCEELRFILAHEMAHLKRHDIWIHLTQRIAETFLFFNPALWVLNRRISLLREYCCDDLAVRAHSVDPQQSKLQYAAALLKVVEISTAGRSQQPDLVTLAATGRTPSELRRRIARLFGEPLREPVGMSHRGLLMLFGTLLLSMGPILWPTSGADEVKPESNDGTTQTFANQPDEVETTRTSDETWPRLFSLKVVGPDGAPVSKANVELRTKPAVTKDQIVIGEYVKDGVYGNFADTDEDGVLQFQITRRPTRFQISIRQVGLAQYCAIWSPSEKGETIPGSFTAQLDASWVVGGIIVDENDQPIEGAIVRPSVQFKMRPGDKSELGLGNRVKTDADGKWRFEFVPVSAADVFVEVNHPNFQPHLQNLDRETFGLTGDAVPSEKIQLARGLSVTGKVVDESGMPIEDALIRTQFRNDVREARTDKDGIYKLVGCDAKMARIVVSAKGKATDLQTVPIAADVAPVNFVMKTGGHVRVRVVDEDGKGIPKARIFYQRWRDERAYWEFDHKNQYADENGVWEWNEAPLDEFMADICHPNGMYLMKQRLSPREAEYVFAPPTTLRVAGTVIDSNTKQPIKTFRVVPGTRDSPDFGRGINWETHDAFDSVNGRYKVERHRVVPAHLLRIEADGYKIASSREIMSDEGNVEVNFELEPTKQITVKLMSPDGQPAIGAKVAVATGRNQVIIDNGEIDQRRLSATTLVPDSTGTFTITQQDEVFHLVVTHETGFAHLISSDGVIPNVVTLTAWARAEGIFRVGDQPMANTRLRIDQNGNFSSRPGPSIFSWSVATTGPDGRYRFDRVVPGRTRIGREIISVHGEGATEVTSGTYPSAEFVAGKTTTLEIGGSGRPVIGKLLPRTDYAERVLWSFASVFVEADLQPPTAEEAPADVASNPERRKEWWEAWKTTPQGVKWQQEYLEYERVANEALYMRATVDRDGSFRIDDVPTGKWAMRVHFGGGGPRAAGSLRSFRFSVPDVQEGQSPDPIQLGDIQLQ